MAATPPPFSWRILIVNAFGVLVFRRPSAAIAMQWPACLAFGLAFTQQAGIGRYWDHTRAEPWQMLGLGSVADVSCLALLLWLVVWPLHPKRWSYCNALVFVALTSPPAVLYAIPVERFLALDAAQVANAWFLAIVATGRLALCRWNSCSPTGPAGWPRSSAHWWARCWRGHATGPERRRRDASFAGHP